MTRNDAIVENQNHSRDPYAIGVVFAALGTFLFALKSVWIKLAFAAGADVLNLLTLRLLFSAPFYVAVLVWSYRQRQAAFFERNDWLAIGIGVLGYYLASYLDMEGLDRISAQLERLTLFTYPTLVALLAWILFKERPSKFVWAAIAICYFGIGLMFFGELRTAPTTRALAGVLFVLGAAMSYSVYLVLSMPLIRKLGSMRFTSWAMLGACGVMLVHFRLERDWAELIVSPALNGYAMVLAFVCTVLPSFMVSAAIQRLGATRTATIGSAGPVVTVALAWLVLGESLTPLRILGMGAVLFGVALVRRDKQSHSDEPSQSSAATEK